MQNETITNILRQLEEEHRFRILFAAESGSRAWGFASPDSDYDIRIIYVPEESFYWSLEEKPCDTFEAMLPGDLDLSGWELRKTLRLFAGCNLALNEWLNSPIVYRADTWFQQNITALLPDYFNPVKAVHHYLAMSEHGFADLASDGSIAIKKLFYGLRGLFAAAWADRFRTMPPTEFRTMLTGELLPESVLQTVEALLERKRIAGEKGVEHAADGRIIKRERKKKRGQHGKRQHEPKILDEIFPIPENNAHTPSCRHAHRVHVITYYILNFPFCKEFCRNSLREAEKTAHSASTSARRGMDCCAPRRVTVRADALLANAIASGTEAPSARRTANAAT